MTTTVKKLTATIEDGCLVIGVPPIRRRRVRYRQDPGSRLVPRQQRDRASNRGKAFVRRRQCVHPPRLSEICLVKESIKREIPWTNYSMMLVSNQGL